MTATLRPANPADAKPIADLFFAAQNQMAFLPPHTESQSLKFIFETVLREDEVWVAVTQGKVAGFAALKDDLLRHLYVHPALQNHGLGGALLEQAKCLRPQGFSLWTFQANQGARRFYERHGLTLAKLTDGTDNQERLPDALYVWQPSCGKNRSRE